MNALIITDTTAVRMNVIAQRTQNLLVAGAKAMMIQLLRRFGEPNDLVLYAQREDLAHGG